MSAAPVFPKVGDLVRVDFSTTGVPFVYDEDTRPSHLGPHEVISVDQRAPGEALVNLVCCAPGDCVGVGVWNGVDRLPSYFLHEDAYAMGVWERIVLDRVRTALLARSAS